MEYDLKAKGYKKLTEEEVLKLVTRLLKKFLEKNNSCDSIRSTFSIENLEEMENMTAEELHFVLDEIDKNIQTGNNGIAFRKK